MLQLIISLAGVVGAMPGASTQAAPVPSVASIGLHAAEQRSLEDLVRQHKQTRNALPADTRADLDRLTGIVRRQLFAGPLPANLFAAGKQIVSRTIPGLSDGEAGTLAAYSLDGIADMGIGAASSIGGGSSAGAIGAAAGGSGQDQLINATKQMQETQMSFNLQYLQLQLQMQNENRSFTAVSNIMKTKHDTVKNSINNVR